MEEEIVVEFSEKETQVLCIYAAIGMGAIAYGFACAVGKADKASSKAADFLSDKIVERIKNKKVVKCPYTKTFLDVVPDPPEYVGFCENCGTPTASPASPEKVGKGTHICWSCFKGKWGDVEQSYCIICCSKFGTCKHTKKGDK